MCRSHLEHLPDIIIFPFWHKSIFIAYECDFNVDYFLQSSPTTKHFSFYFLLFTQYSHIIIGTQLHENEIYNT